MGFGFCPQRKVPAKRDKKNRGGSNRNKPPVSVASQRTLMSVQNTSRTADGESARRREEQEQRVTDIAKLLGWAQDGRDLIPPPYLEMRQVLANIASALSLAAFFMIE